MAAIYLIRHGQASWGKRDYDNLSPTGIEQARVLGKALQQRIGKPDQVIVGAMRRHRQTADATLDAMQLRFKWQEDPRWNEYDHQELIVRQNPLYRSRAVMMADMALSRNPKRKFQDFFEKALARWVSDKHSHEYKENWPAFKQRINSALKELHKAQGNTLVFTSGGAISASVRQLWTMPDEEWLRLNRIIANATVTKIVAGKRGLHLSTFNEHAHFEGEFGHLLTYR